MWYKVNKRLIGTQQVRPANNFVFDFQNNWLSWCTLAWSTSYAWIESWQWIYLYWNGSASYWLWIYLPSYVFGKSIKQLILNCYYPSSYWNWKWFWLQKSGGVSFRYSREQSYQSYIWFADGVTTSQNIWLFTGEITITMNFWNWVISWTVNNTLFSVSNSAANTIRDWFIDWTANLLMVSWQTTSKSYLRKATIITE